MDATVEKCAGYGACMSQDCKAANCVLKRDTGRGYVPSRQEAVEATHRCPTLDDAFGCPICMSQVNRANAERRIAELAVKPAPEKAGPLTVLEEAGLLVNDGGDRNDSYDHPYHNFSKIAQVWAIIFGVPVTPRQVSLAMIGMKLVRDSHKGKRDNIVDIAGYARCIERLEEWESRPDTPK